MLLKLSPSDQEPKYKRILTEIIRKIEEKSLISGERLPSTRTLSEKLGVHRSTVMAAYQELWALGYIDMGVGSRPIVRQRPLAGLPGPKPHESIIPWDRIKHRPFIQSDNGAAPLTSKEVSTDENKIIDFTRLEVDPRLYPTSRFQSCLSAVLTDESKYLLGYSNPTGHKPLRDYLSRFLTRYCISVEPDEIFITNGSQHGLYLILRLLASPGRTVIVESPTYKEFIMLMDSMDLIPVSIPMTSAGMDLDVLEAHLKSCTEAELPALIYTMPNFQNPTGITSTQSHRERLLHLAEKYRIPLIEDGFQEEMKYHGKVTLPIKSMDQKGIVLYCSSFSKILFPGLRIGWIAADRSCIEQFTAMRQISELSPNSIMQAAALRFCTEGHFDRHISRMHRTYRKRMDTALNALDSQISKEWAQWDAPVGGYLIWLRLLDPRNKPKLTESQWESAFNGSGIRLRMGSVFFCTATDNTYIRLSIATLNEDEILLGIERLSSVLSQIHTTESQEGI